MRRGRGRLVRSTPPRLALELDCTTQEARTESESSRKPSSFSSSEMIEIPTKLRSTRCFHDHQTEKHRTHHYPKSPREHPRQKAIWDFDGSREETGSGQTRA